MHVACNYHTKDQVIQFLTGLNEKFYVVKTQGLLINPLPQEDNKNRVITSHVSLDESSAFVNASDRREFQNRGEGFSSGSDSKNGSEYTTFIASLQPSYRY